MSRGNVMKITKKATAVVLSAAMVFTMIPTSGAKAAVTQDDDTPYVISQGRAAYSSSDVGNSTADKAVDGDESTRWESKSGSDNEWFYVDLGKKAQISSIFIKWEAAYAENYKIQFSNDEENWDTVYVKGADTTEGETEKPQDINIKYKVKDGIVSADWTNISGATYKVCVNDENTVATAPDGYKFNSHKDSNGTIKLDPGTYKLIVIALKDGKEVSRGDKEIVVPEIGETVTSEPESETAAPEPVNKLEDTINIKGEARYVRIQMTKRATNYGYSMYEFQVYGTGSLTERPVDYGENLALNKEAKSSGLKDVWWMYDKNGNKMESEVEKVLEKNAFDGNTNTKFCSAIDDNQWIYVDLGKSYELGRVIIDWDEAAGKIYDVDVSEDATTWTTVYRQLNGYREFKDEIPVYVKSARYVRVHDYTKIDNNAGIEIKEIAVYGYRQGDEKKTYTISELPSQTVVKTKAGSYLGSSLYREKTKKPVFIDEENIKLPIASNDWWQSAMILKFGNTMSTLPFKATYSAKGLSVLTTSDGWLPTMKETDVNVSVITESKPDLYIQPENIDTTTAYDRVHKYSDYSADLQLCDKNGVAMTSTHVKGSPYIFCDFANKEAVYVSVPYLTEFFDDNGNDAFAGSTKITTDHIGIMVTDNDNKEGKETSVNYYCLTLPEGTTVKRTGSTLKILFPGSDRYMSVGTMQKKSELNEFYKHGYAFITDTKVTYKYEENMSKVTSNYDVKTEVKRAGFSETTMQLMLPHQWKNSSENADTVSTYKSVRGNMHGIWSNNFSTVETFAGLLPEFAMPQSSDFDKEKVLDYLSALLAATANSKPGSDAYWQGKDLHPLGMGALMADQLGETELRDEFLSRIKVLLVDWFNYSGADDPSFFVYDNAWGTLYYKDSEFGAHWGICDHHFTYGYFVFAATVLATYDEEFYNDYKDMIEMLIRDYANPSDNDSEYCRFRAYDLYEGHSWAGGYADNDNGNNQESASESLFSWVGMYLWGVLTGDDTYRDAGVFGFTNEMEAVEQYWFDYDKDNWIEDWPYEVVAQVYGGGNFYGTFFGGQPLYCYGIQWLPLSEYLTYYGMNQERAAEIYKGLENDTETAKKKAYISAINEGKTEEEAQNIVDTYATPDNGWQHITWTFLSQTDPIRALNKFNEDPTKVQNSDRANVYWFMNSVKELGVKTTDVIATGDLSASVYYNKSTGKYTSNVWNPCNTAKVVTFKDKTGKTLGTATVGAKATVSFTVDENRNFNYTQLNAPTFKTTALANENDVQNNVTGTKTYDDTQLVEIACEDKDATIYYTTDGTIPSTDSKVYDGSILVSSTCTIKAIAVKDGCINSTYASVNIKINGTTTVSDENLALGKSVQVSSVQGAGDGYAAANLTDGNVNSRWASATGNDDEYCYVDLGDEYTINTVKLTWEAACASKYKILVSTDEKNWDEVANVTNGTQGERTTSFPATKARYVKMQGIERVNSGYGYSIYEFEVYGALKAAAPTITPGEGTYNGSQKVTLSTAVKGAEVKYTLDGTEPTENSASYKKPITVSKSTVIKAATYRKGMELSDSVSAVMIISGTISFAEKEITVAQGDTKKITAYTDAKISWSSDDNNVASVDENGNVTGNKIGTTKVTATLPNGNKEVCNITVVKAVHIQSIALSTNALEMKNRTSVKLDLTINPADTTDDTTAVWKSDNEKILTVDNDGTITAKREGNATVKVTVGNFTAECKVTVGPAATVYEMIPSKRFNIALGKNATVSSNYEAEGSHDPATLTNGNISDTAYVTSWDRTQTSEYVVIDLGETYNTDGLDKVAVQFNNAQTFASNIEVQYSTNGVEYTTVKEATGLSYDTSNGLAEIKIPDSSDKIAATRYVKVIMKGHLNWGFQIKEVAVLSTQENAVPVETQKCDDPADLTVSSDNFFEITYTIKAAENQAGYKYMVFVDGAKVTDLVNAGTGKITGISKGTHKVTVVSYYNGLTSEGISRDVYVDDGSLVSYIDTYRNIAKGCAVTVNEIYTGEGSQNTAVLTDGKISTAVTDIVETKWGEKKAQVIIDLGKSYKPSDINEVIMAFKEDKTYASDYTVEFSSDNSNFETVVSKTGVAYKETIEDKVDISKYSQQTVRYVKFNFNAGAQNWGYQLSELAVIANDSSQPEQPTETPTTVAPTTVAPTTEAPTTEAPTTVAPTTEVPTTEAPTTVAPTTVAPTTEAPTTEAGGFTPVQPFGVNASSKSDGILTVVWGQNQEMIDAGQVYSVYIDDEIAVTTDGTKLEKVPATEYNIKTTGGKHKLKIVGVVGDKQSEPYVQEVEVMGQTEAPTEEVTTKGIEINGMQISTTVGGNRTVYTVEPEINGQEVVERGMIYGLAPYATEEDMYIGAETKYVKAFAATDEGKINEKLSGSDKAQTYAMTMRQNIGQANAKALSAKYLIRAYAKLKDGSYVYTDIANYSVFSIADTLYKGCMMTSAEQHQYLYDNILSVVDKNYEVVKYNWNNTVVSPASNN